MTPKIHEIGLESRIALERLIVMAETQILMCLPTLIPAVPVASPRLHGEGFDLLTDLLALMSDRGVAVRLLMPTPDPVLHADAHRRAWAAASDLVTAVMGDVQVLCARHAHRPGRLACWKHRADLSAALSEMRAHSGKDMTPEQRQVRRGHRPRTAGLGQSFVLVDGTAVLFGGFGFDGAPAVSVETGGSAAAVLRQIFQRDWNAALVEDAGSPGATAQPLPLSAHAQPTRHIRSLRTEAKPGRAWLPEPELAQTHKTLLRALASARHRVLIRTALLSDPDVVAALDRVARRSDISLRLRLGPGAALPAALDGMVIPEAPDHHDPWSGLIVVDADLAILGVAALDTQSLRHDTGTTLMFRNPPDVSALAQTF